MVKATSRRAAERPGKAPAQPAGVAELRPRQSSLLAAVSLTEAATSRRSTIPILSNLLLASDGKRLTVVGTDLDTEVAVEIESVWPAFETTAPARLLLDAVSFHGGGCDLAISVDKRLTVGADPAFMLATLPTKTFPRINAAEPVVAFDLPAAQFFADLDDVAPAMSTEETRFYLNGICFHVVGGDLAMAATDGHRLHQTRRPMPRGASDLPRPIVRSAAVRLLLRALKAAIDDNRGFDQPLVRCEFGAGKARFTIGKTTITTRLIEGEFPGYERVIPEYPDGAGSLTADADDLRRIAEAGRVLSVNATLVIDFAKGAVRLKDGFEAEMTASLPGSVEGETPAQIAIHPGYLRDICSATTVSIRAAFRGPADPIKFTTDDDVFVGVVMPRLAK